MITNGMATQENYYRIKFANLPYDHWEYGDTALQAIATARHDLIESGNEYGPLGNATARLAVYKEWDYGTDRYTNGGDFIRGPRTVN
jgi:hypothetical protein